MEAGGIEGVAVADDGIGWTFPVDKVFIQYFFFSTSFLMNVFHP